MSRHTAAPFGVHPDRSRDRSRDRGHGRLLAGFTLIEVVFVLLLLGIAVAITVAGYSSVQRASVDRAGSLALLSAQSDGRRAVAATGQEFPHDLHAALLAQLAADTGTTPVSDPSGAGQPGTVVYVSGSSNAVGTDGSSDGQVQVSVASGPDAIGERTVAAYAVETSRDEASHCWFLLDRMVPLADGDGDPAARSSLTWGYGEDVPVGTCAAQTVLTCPELAAGTLDAPADAGAECALEP